MRNLIKSLLALLLASVSLFYIPLVWGCLGLGEHELVCPFDGAIVSASQLDPLPLCPHDGFVMYKETFTEQELARFKDFIATPRFKSYLQTYYINSLLSSSTSQTTLKQNYFIAGQLMIFNHEHPRTIAHMLLKAVPENSTDQAFKQYAQAALAAFNESLRMPYSGQNHWLESDKKGLLINYSNSLDAENHKMWIEDQIIAGDLERRLGGVSDAEQRFKMLLAEKIDPLQTVFINQKLSLVEWHNSQYFNCAPNQFVYTASINGLSGFVSYTRSARCGFVYEEQKCHSYGFKPFATLTGLILALIAAIFFAPDRARYPQVIPFLASSTLLAIAVAMLWYVSDDIATIYYFVLAAFFVSWHQPRLAVKITFYFFLISIPAIVSLFSTNNLYFKNVFAGVGTLGLFILLTWLIYTAYRAHEYIHTLIVAVSATVVVSLLPMFLYQLFEWGHSFKPNSLIWCTVLIGYVFLALSIYLNKMKKMGNAYRSSILFWLNIVTPILLLHPIAIYVGLFDNTHAELNMLAFTAAGLLLMLVYRWMGARIHLLPISIYLLHALLMLYLTYHAISIAILMALPVLLLFCCLMFVFARLSSPLKCSEKQPNNL